MSVINSVKRSPIVIALDFTSAEQALAFADEIDPAKARLKVGKELFTYAGPNLVRELHQRGFDVFLDLKFHDIPNTAASAVAAAADLGVWMVNVHASGGRRMLIVTIAFLGFIGTCLLTLLLIVALRPDILGIQTHVSNSTAPAIDPVLLEAQASADPLIRKRAQEAIARF